MPAFDLIVELTHETRTHVTVQAASRDEAVRAAANRFAGAKGVRVLEAQASEGDLMSARASLRGAWQRFQLAAIAADDAARDFDQALLTYQSLMNERLERRGERPVNFINARLGSRLPNEPDLTAPVADLYRGKFAQFKAAGS